MKLKNSLFLAKANLKGNTKTASVILTTLILVISLTLISSFSITVQRRVEEYKADPKAKIFQITPYYGLLKKDIIEKIKKIDHVESVTIDAGMRHQLFEIISISDDNGVDKDFQKLLVKKKDSNVIFAESLIGTEKRPVIAGKSLDETPEFSCIISDKFYPFDDIDEYSKDFDPLDAESFIGKTLTVTPWGENGYEIWYNTSGDEKTYVSEFDSLPALNYTLKIVGVYRDRPTFSGGNYEIFVSEKTAGLIEKMALETSTIDLTSKTHPISVWYNNPSIHNHYVTVDDFDNIEYVQEKIKEINVDCYEGPEHSMEKSVLQMAEIFKTVSLILITSAIILCIIIIMQSSLNSLLNRKNEIGLLKAIGYKNKQIFSAFYYEQMILTIKGFLIGTGFSAIIVAVINYINSYTAIGNRLYIVSWIDVSLFLALSLAIVIIVPLLCQVIMLHKLNKIQPREAMNES